MYRTRMKKRKRKQVMLDPRTPKKRGRVPRKNLPPVRRKRPQPLPRTAERWALTTRRSGRRPCSSRLVADT